jgi:hypothetical protein
LLCKKKIIIAKSKEVETGWSISQEWSNLAQYSKKNYDKKGCFSNDFEFLVATVVSQKKLFLEFEIKIINKRNFEENCVKCF